MEGYTARDALIVLRMDLTDSLEEIDHEIAELAETLEFSGIAEQMLQDEASLIGDPALTDFPPIRRWLENVSNAREIREALEGLRAEREQVATALQHLEERLTGRSTSPEHGL